MAVPSDETPGKIDTAGLLAEAALLLGRTLDPGRVYDILHAMIARSMDCDTLLVSQHDPGDNSIRCVYAWIEGKRVATVLGRASYAPADVPYTEETELFDREVVPGRRGSALTTGSTHLVLPVEKLPESPAFELIPPPFRGLDRYEARKRIVAELDAQGLLERTQPHKLMVPRGDRSNAVVEPYLTDQWYVRVAPLAEPAVRAVETGAIRFVPENWSKTYYEWMRNIEDWCISRQIWWGHQIPAWYGPDGTFFVEESEEEARAAARKHYGKDVELTREDVDAFDFQEIPDRVISPGGLTAFPALVDLGETTALRVFERRDEALAAHRGGVERLLRRALAEPIKRAQRQLPLRNALMLKWAAFGSAESLRIDLVEGALRELFGRRDLDIRSRDDFEHAREEIARALLATAMERHAVVEDIIAGYAELKPLLEPPLMGYARANYDDLREQLDALVFPGFVRDTEAARLSQFPRYLKAMRLRAERLRQDAARDQARMLTVRVYWTEYLKMSASGASNPALAELRWLIEELRVSLFAQELKTAEPVSPKRLAKLIDSLRSAM